MISSWYNHGVMISSWYQHNNILMIWSWCDHDIFTSKLIFTIASSWYHHADIGWCMMMYHGVQHGAFILPAPPPLCWCISASMMNKRSLTGHGSRCHQRKIEGFSIFDLKAFGSSERRASSWVLSVSSAWGLLRRTLWGTPHKYNTELDQILHKRSWPGLVLTISEIRGHHVGNKP